MHARSLATVVAFAAIVCTSSAQAYSGDWAFKTNDGDRESLYLGDASDGTVIHLRGTRNFCGLPGDKYDWVRTVLVNNGTSGQRITWWITHKCDGYIRVCLENRFSQIACSSYLNFGWQRTP